jgi:hypothetical protein
VEQILGLSCDDCDLVPIGSRWTPYTPRSGPGVAWAKAAMSRLTSRPAVDTACQPRRINLPACSEVPQPNATTHRKGSVVGQVRFRDVEATRGGNNVTQGDQSMDAVVTLVLLGWVLAPLVIGVWLYSRAGKKRRDLIQSSGSVELQSCQFCGYQDPNRDPFHCPKCRRPPDGFKAPPPGF